jgi:hypothetical protein
MSVTDAIDAWVKLEFNKNSSTKSDALKLLFEIE